jgi:uncharacterized protein
MEIYRAPEINTLTDRVKNNPIVAILGPRQCGKTTLSRQFSSKWPSEVAVFDLEDPRDINRLENPMSALEDMQGLIIIDEIQRQPELFPVLRVLADKPSKTRYLILGSASRDLIRQGSESLAGRIAYLEIGGFSFAHVGPDNMEKLWLRGGFPRSFLASKEESSYQWRQDFISTFLERDIPQLGINIPAKALRRFWSMLAHYHGRILNASEIGKSLAISDHTVQKYLDLLSGTFMVRQLQPWYYNTKKRLVKRPKIYFRDTGILHALLSLEQKKDVLTHPICGSSWEGFALENVAVSIGKRSEELYFWNVHSGAELDLFWQHKGRNWGVEFKYVDAPILTKSMQVALRDLKLAHIWVIYPGKEDYKISPKVTAKALRNLTPSWKYQ